MEKCKWHKCSKPCNKCEKDLQKTSDKLNEIFSGITIEFGKDGKPKVSRT